MTHPTELMISAILKGLEADVYDSTLSLSLLAANLAEIDLTKSAHNAAIATARGLCDQFTKSDVLRLRDELRSVQAMHGWEVERVGKESMRVVLGGEVVLDVPLTQAQTGEVVMMEHRKAGQDNMGVMAGLREVFRGAVAGLDLSSLGVSRVCSRGPPVDCFALELRRVLSSHTM